MFSVGDLQWTALSPWRALARELFSSSERAAELVNIREVEMMHTRGGESRAMLFAGWLASSLGWEPKGGGPNSGREFVFDGPSGEEIVFRTSPSTDDADLSRITLRAGECSFVISRHKELTEAHISVERGGEEIARRAVRIGRFDMGAMLGEELKFKGRDPIYESSLEKVMEMMET
jgi:glucose-6-phosphate dehydrogenase assembly protein OpcA